MMNKLHFIGCDKTYEESKLVIIGAPFDGTVSFKPGTRFAPNQVRLDSDGIETYSPYQDKDIEDISVYDDGDTEVVFGNKIKTLDNIKNKVTNHLKNNKKVLTIGGEHLITLPIIQAYHEFYNDLVILHFDAHTDLREDYLGEELSHATVMKRVHDLLGDQKIFQFGIRSGLKEEFDFAKEHLYIEPFSCNTIKTVIEKIKDKPVYISLDLDVLDPSIMSGTGTQEAGGLSFKELHNALLDLKDLNIIGADIVELSPHLDPSGTSTMVACKLIRELLLLIK